MFCAHQYVGTAVTESSIKSSYITSPLKCFVLFIQCFSNSLLIVCVNKYSSTCCLFHIAVFNIAIFNISVFNITVFNIAVFNIAVLILQY